MIARYLLQSAIALVACACLHPAKASEELLKDKNTILVLGDSITQAGQYVTDFDAWLVKKYPDRRYTVIKAVDARMKIYQKAIHAETDPKRPGVPKGGTMESAAHEAKALEAQIFVK